MDDDRRLTGQVRYLQGATFVRKPYRVWSETWEHDHCEFCWAKFVEAAALDLDAAAGADGVTVQTKGYAAIGAGPEDQDDYHWVCVRCFEDFRERFAWMVASPSE